MEEIIQLPPLAILLNGVVEALNEIRNCAPTNVVQGAAQALRKTLDAIVKTLEASDLPEAVAEAPDAPPRSVKNPFA